MMQCSKGSVHVDKGSLLTTQNELILVKTAHFRTTLLLCNKGVFLTVVGFRRTFREIH